MLPPRDRDLRRRITFKHVSARLDQLQDRIEYAMLHPDSAVLSVADLNNELDDIAHWVAKHSNGLFIEKIRGFQFKLRLFGLHFASLDIRQDSRVIRRHWMKRSLWQVSMSKPSERCRPRSK